MNSVKIDHIGLAVPSIEGAQRFYREILKLKEESGGEVHEMGLRCRFFSLGDSRLELMEPLGDEGPVQQHLKHCGPGVQHIALAVDDLDTVIEEMRAKKVWLVGEPQVIQGRKVCFVHPVVAGGVVLELMQAPSD